MKSNWRLVLISLTLAFLLRCATTQDCSAFPVTSYERCTCIRDNGDEHRALQCNRELTKKMSERAAKECLSKCWGDNCVEKCNNL